MPLNDERGSKSRVLMGGCKGAGYLYDANKKENQSPKLGKLKYNDNI